MTPQPKFKPGAAYRNGKLYEFTSCQMTVMKGWPRMQAWVWSVRNPRWIHARPELKRVSLNGLSREPDPDLHPPDPDGQMRFPFAYARAGRSAYRAFWWRVPPAIRELAMPFYDRRWHMLSLLARCPGAEDLARGNPALAFCLASNGCFHDPAPSHPLRAARALVFRKQRRILEWLGFPGTESARQALRRVPPETMTVWFLRNLRDALRDPRYARPIGFLGRINEAAFSILTAPAGGPPVEFSLLEEIAHNPAMDAHTGIAGRIRDIGRLCEMLSRRPPRLRSLDQVDEVHEELVYEVNLRQAAEEGPLPPPPVPGRAGEIEPLTSCRDLAAEGRQQNHCVGSYVRVVRRGRVYIYRMLKPERATLAIVPGRAGWILREIRGFHNADVGPESVTAARDWLQDQPSGSLENTGVDPAQGPVIDDDIPF